VLAMLNGEKSLENPDSLKREFAAASETRRWISAQIYKSREKDHSNPFRKATFRNDAEMEKVLGKAGDDAFVRLALQEGKVFEELTESIMKRL